MQQSTAGSEGQQKAAAEKDLNVIVSQREYTPTPYQPSQWEIVGERLDTTRFIGMDLPVLRGEEITVDPMFDDFPSDTPALPQGSIFTAPGGDYVAPAESDPERAPFDLALFEAELQARFEEGRQEGIREGAQAAEAQIVAKYERLGAQLKEITDRIQAEVSERMQQLERRALKLSLEVARKLVHTTVEVKPDYIIEIIRRGVTGLGAAKPLRVRLSPQDFEFIELVGVPPELSETELGVTYVADPSIHSGCVVESDFGELNLELDKMWEEVARAVTSVAE